MNRLFPWSKIPLKLLFVKISFVIVIGYNIGCSELSTQKLTLVDVPPCLGVSAKTREEKLGTISTLPAVNSVFDSK